MSIWLSAAGWAAAAVIWFWLFAPWRYRTVKVTISFFDGTGTVVDAQEITAPAEASYFQVNYGPLPDGEQYGGVTLVPGGPPRHEVVPARTAPWYGPDDREVPPNGELAAGSYPMTSNCVCGRMITKEGLEPVWEHSD